METVHLSTGKMPMSNSNVVKASDRLLSARTFSCSLLLNVVKSSDIGSRWCLSKNAITVRSVKISEQTQVTKFTPFSGALSIGYSWTRTI